jgi:peptide/nickel transport system permease protein
MDYVRTARAKGLSNRRVYFIHAFRNALIPLATILGPTVTGLLAGSIIAETIWSWPGLGRLTIQATFQRDYPVIMAGLVVGSLAVIIGNLISDILYGVFDPRVSLR